MILTIQAKDMPSTITYLGRTASNMVCHTASLQLLLPIDHLPNLRLCLTQLITCRFGPRHRSVPHALLLLWLIGGAHLPVQNTCSAITTSAKVSTGVVLAVVGEGPVFEGGSAVLDVAGWVGEVVSVGGVGGEGGGEVGARGGGGRLGTVGSDEVGVLLVGCEGCCRVG